MFRDLITSERELRELFGEPSEVALKKEKAALNETMRAFIATSPFLLLATSGADGRCDVSPKGDAPGFVKVLDEKRLVIPDRIGNNRVDGHRNVLANGHIGLIFLIPGREDTLRVNGRARLTRDPELLASMLVQGKPPKLAIGVEVEECFMHCAKAFKRSRLWQADAWPSAQAAPSMAEILMETVKPVGMTLDDMEKRLEEGYRTRMY
ncbi:MAG: pyridoxamine 5'-phosphate oxidase family protein [Chloroflexota bacterium]|nr:pyridoxamine 5'-phosphate oxidase family protein [Chloroflexota bacterium]